MAEKTWGGEPFWGLGYEWDPDWFLTERQQELRAQLIDLCENEMRANAKRSDDELLYPRRNFEILAENGFLALTVPEEYGGLGENHVAFTMVCETLARYGCASTAMCYVMHMGAVATIMLRPTPELVDKYIRPLGDVQDRHAVLLGPRDRLALLVPVLVEGRALERRLQGQQEGVVDDLRRLRRLLRRADDQPGLQGLRRPLGVRHRRRARQGAALAVGRARAARQPVRSDPGRGRRDPRRADRRPDRRRRDLQRRGGRSLVPDRLLVGVERDHDGRDRHRQAPHDAQAPRRRGHARGGLPDDPGLRRRGRDGHERLPRVRAVGGAGDGPRDRRQPARPRARRDRPRGLPALGLADQVRGGQEHRPPRRQDAARLRRLGLQARHGARALRARRQGRLGDGPDQRGAAPVRRQGRPARLRRARLLEPDLQSPRGRERGQEARRRGQARPGQAAARSRPTRTRRRSRQRRRDGPRPRSRRWFPG